MPVSTAIALANAGGWQFFTPSPTLDATVHLVGGDRRTELQLTHLATLLRAYGQRVLGRAPLTITEPRQRAAIPAGHQDVVSNSVSGLGVRETVGV